MNDLISLIKKNNQIPIIGKGSNQEIEEKFYKLVSKNYKVIEITLRSENALDLAIYFKKKFPDLFLGIGSINTLKQLKNLIKEDFKFYISPGYTIDILKFVNSEKINFIPGVSTSSEIMDCLNYDIKLLKFFHSENNGGVKTLNQFKDVFYDVIFIPTGGINHMNKDSYLKLDNVLGVGSTSF